MQNPTTCPVWTESRERPSLGGLRHLGSQIVADSGMVTKLYQNVTVSFRITVKYLAGCSFMMLGLEVPNTETEPLHLSKREEWVHAN